MNDREGDSVSYRAPRVDLTMKDFEILAHLGDGSFSSVVLAKMRTSEQKYAIKIVNKHLLMRNKMASCMADEVFLHGSPLMMRAFLQVEYVKRERMILDRVDYGGITKLFFTFQDPSSLFLGLEYCPGGDLYEQIKVKGKLTIEEVKFYSSEIVLVLEYLRTSEIVHRDIKPENLLLDDAGHLKLSDFGCARAFFLAPASSSPASGPSLGGIGIKPERSTSFVGTAEYVSPEVLKNEPLSYPADLWALGCVIFQMLTGKPPFKGASEYLTFQLVSEGVYSYPSDDEAGGDKIPMEAKDLVDKLLVLEPDKRLGASSIDELKSHPYFTGVEWSRVRESKAPDFIRPSPPTADQEGLNWEFSSLMRDVEGQHGHIRYERTDDKDEDSD